MQLKDTRAEVADFALGNFALDPPHFKIRVGAEAKRSVPAIMNTLPDIGREPCRRDDRIS